MKISILIFFTCSVFISAEKDDRCSQKHELKHCFRLLPSYIYSIDENKCMPLPPGKCIKQSLLGELLSPKDFRSLSSCKSTCVSTTEPQKSTTEPSTTEPQKSTTEPSTTVKDESDLSTEEASTSQPEQEPEPDEEQQ